MGPGAHVESMRVATVGSRQYQVTAAIESGNAEYYATFTLGPGANGLLITDHYTVKPQ